MPKIPSVILVTQYLGLGGLERMILNLSGDLTHLGDHSWKPIVFVYDEIKGGATLHGEFEKQKIPVATLKKKPGFSIKVVFALIKLALKNNARILHTHDLGALIYGVLARILTLGWLKICHTQHSFIHLEKAPRYKKYEKIFTAFASQVSTVSEALKSQYKEIEIDPSRIEVIPNGVPFVAPPPPTQLLEFRKTVLANHPNAKMLERHLDKVWVLCMARIHPKKGQNHVIDAWAKLPTEVKKIATLVILGQATSEETLTALETSIKAHGITESCYYAGLTYTPTRWIQVSDIFASGSEFEGMPLGPIEALGGGLDVWLSNIPGHALLPRVSSHSPQFFELGDLESAAEKLSGLIRTVAPGIVDATLNMRHSNFTAAASLREAYGTKSMAKRYAALYRSC